MRNHLKIIAIFTILMNATLAFSGENNCPVSKKELYSRFREYRTLINNEYVNYEQLAKYYDNSENKKYVDEIKGASNEIDLYRSMDKFEFNLKYGEIVKVVYGYSINCPNTKNVQLILNAFTYFSLTPFKRKNTNPSKVTINYKKEAGGWKIVNFVIDNRKNKISQLPTNNVIDDFR